MKIFNIQLTVIAVELQNEIQRKAQELPPDLLQEVYDYMEFIIEKTKKRSNSQDQDLEKWWNNIDNFSSGFLNRFQSIPWKEVSISSIVVAELWFGVAKKPTESSK